MGPRRRVLIAGLSFAVLVGSSCISQEEILTPLSAANAGSDGGSSLDAGAGADAGSDAGCAGGAPWALRVLVGVEQSGRMCVLDPPGAQASSGPCDLFASNVQLPAGAVPRRVTAVRQLFDALPPFSTPDFLDVGVRVMGIARYPLNVGGQAFVAPDDPFLRTGLAATQSELGTANDLQAGLRALVDAVEAEAVATPPPARARTTYLVLLMSSGVPFPRCAADDNRPAYASPLAPQGTWADDPIAPRLLGTRANFDCYDAELPGADWCSNPNWSSMLDGGAGPSDGGAGHLDSVCEQVPWLAGRDYNQTDQLLALVDELMGLEQRYGLGQVRLHTVLNWDQTQLSACGVLCSYFFYPWDTRSMRPAGRWLLEQLALRGRGVLVTPPDLVPMDLRQLPGLEPRFSCP